MLKKLCVFLKKLNEENKKMGNFRENSYKNNDYDNLVNINGLPMNNGVDAAGNPFGYKREMD